MSMRALLLATRDRLREKLSLGDGLCEVGIDERPTTPMAGEVFYTVHPGPWAAQGDQNLYEVYGLSVTVTLRLGKVPWDKIGAALLTPGDDGLEARVEAVRKAIHVQWPVIDAANAIIGTDLDGFNETLKLVDVGKPTPRRGSWFWAKTNSKEVAISQTLSFRGAVRVQDTTSIDGGDDLGD